MIPGQLCKATACTISFSFQISANNHETRHPIRADCLRRPVSIHGPLARPDRHRASPSLRWRFQFTGLSRDPTMRPAVLAVACAFQFTGLSRDLTSTILWLTLAGFSFNSRASRETRRTGAVHFLASDSFNSRASRETRRAQARIPPDTGACFNSRASRET